VQEQLEKTERELKIRNYSSKTVKSYLYALREYFIFKKRSIENLDIDNIKDFLLYKQKRGASVQTRNLFLNAIKFFYRDVIKSRQKVDIRSAKKPKRLPIVLSKDEIDKILKATKNKKYKILLSLAYGAGLRVSEIVSLKLKDVDFDGLTLHVKQAKGKKDRITVFPEKLKINIQNLMAVKQQNDYVFESERGGKLTTRTAQKAFENSLKKAGLKKEATFHSLRHSFATHLLENGVDVRYIQELLGHQNIRTTQRYTQVTNPKLKNIKSPL